MAVPSISVRLVPGYEAACRLLAERLDGPLLESGESPATPYLLVIDSRGGYLERVSPPSRKPLPIRFDRPRSLTRLDPLRKAIGPVPRCVVDATAGWGTDALALAAVGHEVTAVERNPAIAALLEYALSCCPDPSIRERLKVVHADSETFLRESCMAPDVVYVDPMFPPRTKSAAVKKPMTTLQDLVEPMANFDGLLSVARTCATQRVVVKRPLNAAPIAPGRSGEIRGRSIRFDLYPARGGES